MRHRTRGKYNKDERPKFSKEELIAYLKANNFRFRSQLRQGRKTGEPTDADYFNCFGSWKSAHDRIFGSDIFFGYDPFNKDYHIKCVTELGLWTEKKYMEARKRCPQDIPSLYAIHRTWKNFRYLKDAASKHSLLRCIDGFRKLYCRLGRMPLREECRAAGVFSDEAIRQFKDRKHFNDFVKNMVRIMEALK